MNQLVELAKLAVETFIKEGKIISPSEDLPKELLERKAGTFVTIEKALGGLPRSQTKLVLRGCIGTYLPTRDNITREVIQNAIAAATEDYRFGPIKKEELFHLSYTVYVLSEPELIEGINELEPKKFGIIVKTVPIISENKKEAVFNGHAVPKTGLLLPDLEGVDTIEKQISLVCQKAEIDPLKEKFLIYKFTTERYQ